MPYAVGVNLKAAPSHISYGRCTVRRRRGANIKTNLPFILTTKLGFFEEDALFRKELRSSLCLLKRQLASLFWKSVSSVLERRSGPTLSWRYLTLLNLTDDTSMWQSFCSIWSIASFKDESCVGLQGDLVAAAGCVDEILLEACEFDARQKTGRLNVRVGRAVSRGSVFWRVFFSKRKSVPKNELSTRRSRVYLPTRAQRRKIRRGTDERDRWAG